MAQTFKINDTNLTYINRANWLDQFGSSQALAGITPLRQHRAHRWESDEMTAAEFDSLHALEGTKLRITTTDYGDPNATDYVEYPGVVVERVVEGQHDGPMMVGVMVDFLVRI